MLDSAPSLCSYLTSRFALRKEFSMSGTPVFCAGILLIFAVWIPLGCARPGEEGRAVVADPDRGAVRTGAESSDSAAIKGRVAEPLESPPMGPFGYSMIASEDGAPLDAGDFAFYDDCAECHERQSEELEGSMHVISHTDPIYRRTAELARLEAGEEIYAYCSGCHAPQGVTAGLIPGTPEAELPEIVKAGILCDVCHQVSSLTGSSGPWSEPGNASIVLSPDEDRKFGPPGGDDDASDHEVETREFLNSSEFCASCHTIIHPLNGLRLEHTYDEWKKSIYAEKGIQCQDCHMRSVEDSIKVAETLTPVVVIGQSEPTGDDREIHPHHLVGANANAEELGGSPEYAAMAEARLKSAARVDLELPPSVSSGSPLEFEVVVHNVAAGHSLPTSLTELREMWMELEVRGEAGQLLFRTGDLQPDGEIPTGAMRFGAIAGDAQGNVTYKPWEVSQFLWKRLVPAKGSARDGFRVDLPDGFSGPVRIEARLLYRSASPRALKSLMGNEAFAPKQVEMARAGGTLVVRE
jgi:hypothetical protein